MPKLLVIESSPQRKSSVSRFLTTMFVDKWRAAFPHGQVVTRDVALNPPPLIDEAWIAGAFSDPRTHSAESAAAMRYSNELVAELQSADHIIIGTPTHNLMIPATLKAYIDQIIRVGLTVSPSNEGLLKDKRAAAIVASGGDLSPGSPSEKFNHLAPYLLTVFGFIGIADMEILMAGPTRDVLSAPQEMANFLKSFDPKLGNIIQYWADSNNFGN